MQAIGYLRWQSSNEANHALIRLIESELITRRDSGVLRSINGSKLRLKIMSRECNAMQKKSILQIPWKRPIIEYDCYMEDV